MRPRRKKIAKPAKNLSEVELCEALIERARRESWIVYPETAGFDILLVATEQTLIVRQDRIILPSYSSKAERIKPGDMIGIEAKLSANVTVLAQAIDRGFNTRTSTGPDFRIAFVKKATRDFRHVARVLRVGVWTLAGVKQRYGYLSPAAMRWTPKKRPRLPSIIPSSVAGSPSPKVLTPWREKALHLILLVEARGYITAEHFKALRIDRRIWVERWLSPDGKEGRLTRYVFREPRRSDFPSNGFENELEAFRAQLPAPARESFASKWSKVIREMPL